MVKPVKVYQVVIIGDRNKLADALAKIWVEAILWKVRKES